MSESTMPRLNRIATREYPDSPVLPPTSFPRPKSLSDDDNPPMMLSSGEPALFGGTTTIVDLYSFGIKKIAYAPASAAATSAMSSTHFHDLLSSAYCSKSTA